MKNQLHKRICCAAMAAVMAVSLAGFPARAESSGEIQDRIDVLEGKHDAIMSQLADLQAQQNDNWEDIQVVVEQKNNIDMQIGLLYAQIDNVNEQIRSYSLLIAENQAALEDAEARLEVLSQKNKARIQAMEEEGDISYWSVLFKAKSFTDLIDRINMIQEIQEADRRRMEELSATAKEVEATRQLLAEEKSALVTSRQELEQAQKELDEKRLEADELLAELNERRSELNQQESDYLAEKNALSDQIAQAEKKYNEAVAREEEERRKQEEATRPTEPEEEEDEDEEDEEDEDEEEEEDDPPEQTRPSESYWLQPCSYICITSPYGWRASGWHNGVDFAANAGTPIYASRSGTVTTAKALIDSNGNYYSYGNYVVINHGDGFSSLYAHMIYFVVSAGEYVNQGELIGYVGSTGNSTGNHLHFTIYYNGSTVNPMNYL